MHKRQAHQSTTKLKNKDNEIITITRSEDGTFSCPEKDCSYTSNRSDTLQRHYKTKHQRNTSDTEKGESENDSSDLVSNKGDFRADEIYLFTQLTNYLLLFFD